MIKITLPLPRYTKAGRSKMLTMNDYRNIHYRVSAQAKRDYTEISILNLLSHRRKHFDAVTILYRFFFETNVRRDIGNIGAVTDKFFSDALVKVGIIEDDDYKIVRSVTYEFGGIGPERVEIYIMQSDE